jgi:hypothetical protein
VRTSADAGLTWRPFGPGAPRGPVLALEVHNGALYAAVEDDGVWSTPLPPPWRPNGEAAHRPAAVD